jgi:hypothetical protein
MFCAHVGHKCAGVQKIFPGKHKIVPQNGEINRKSGLYKSVCCGTEIVLRAGSSFPGCPRHPKLTTLWKPAYEDKGGGHVGKTREFSPLVELHVANRRLFNVACGRIKLEGWERQHLRACKVCTGVLGVFVNQPMPALGEDQSRKDDAA